MLQNGGHIANIKLNLNSNSTILHNGGQHGNLKLKLNDWRKKCLNVPFSNMAASALSFEFNLQLKSR